MASIGYCRNLVDPQGEVIPIGALLVGDANDRPVAGLALVAHGPDLMTAAGLDDTPWVVRDLVDEAFALPSASRGDVLSSVARTRCAARCL